MVTADARAPALTDRRVLVVGASTGIGRAVALAMSAAGAHVVLAARRHDLVREAAEQSDGPAFAVQCDVRTPTDCELAVQAAVQQCGGLDTVVFATGVNRLAALRDTSPEMWRDLIDTNLVGAALVTRAALPELARNGGRIAYLSSHSVAHPWPGLGAYAASKAALDTMIDAWRTEEPSISFTRVVVGPTITGMADAWDPATAEIMFQRWNDEGYMIHDPVPPESVATRVVDWAVAAKPPHDVFLVPEDDR